MTTNQQADWQPPPWLLCHYIAMDEDGSWYGFAFRPVMSVNGWVCGMGGMIRLSRSFVDFDPPPCDDWKTSSRRLRAAT